MTNTYKVTVKYWVQEDIIVEAESEEDAVIQAKESDNVEVDNREALTEFDIIEIEEI